METAKTAATDEVDDLQAAILSVAYPHKAVHEVTTSLFPELRDGEYAELRVIARGEPTTCGYYTNLEDLALAAKAYDTEGWNCYVGLNPRHKPELASENPPLPDGFEGAGDERVMRRQWLLIDVDPDRKGTCCSTAEEKARAWEVFKSAATWVYAEHGWPKPAIIGDSGNGYHGLWRVDEPNDEATRALFEQVLQAIQQHCGTPDAKIDTTVFNAERISRLYGTTNRKGENTPERPHREAKIKAQPATRVVTRAEFAKVAALAQQPAKPKPAATPPVAVVATVQTATTTANQAQITAARAWADQQPAAIAGEGGHPQTFAVACGLVRDWGLSVEQARPILGEYSLRCDPPWSDKELEHKLTNAAEKAVEEPDRVGWRWKVLRKDDDEKKPRSQHDKLVGLMQERASFWTNARQRGFATVEEAGITKHFDVADDYFTDWLAIAYEDEYSGFPTEDALEHASKTAKRLARRSKVVHEAWVRVAHDDDAIYHDLCDETWQVVKITSTRWDIISNPPVRFIRTSYLAPLVRAQHGGTWDELRPLINVSDSQWAIYLAFLVGCFLRRGTFPLLYPHGSEDAGKTTFLKQIHSFVDPSTCDPDTGFPADDEAMLINAANCFLQSHNNVSSIQGWQSDLLCTMLEGGTKKRRTKYADAKASIFAPGRRPIIASGIGEAIRRADLFSRAVIIELQPPTDDKLKLEEELGPEFERVLPRALGCLYDAVVRALRDVDTIDPKVARKVHRCRDFARWAMAAAPAFRMTASDIASALRQNRQRNHEKALESTPLPAAIRAHLRTQPVTTINGRRVHRCTASPTEWLTALSALPHPKEGWPTTAARFGQEISRYRRAMEAVGYEIESGESGKHNTKWLAITLEAE